MKLDDLSKQLKSYWQGLQPRERAVLGFGSLAVATILFYTFAWSPWRAALAHMEIVLPELRKNVVWMQQQDQALSSGAVKTSRARFKGENQSLLSVLEQTAKRVRVRESIQQLVPGNSGKEVRVVMEEANFNQWLAWIDMLYKQYGVDIKQLSAEREDDAPNVAEIRVTFTRK